MNNLDIQPRVSIVVATRDRHVFIPQLLRCIRAQTYPKHLLEIVVGDDGETSCASLFPKGTRFIRYPTPVRLGKKRNDMKRVATGDIIVTMDDDDYYMPSYIEHAVETLGKQDSPGIAALDTAYVLYPNSWSLQVSGPWKDSWPGASFCYTKEYAKAHDFHLTATSGEEWAFTEWHKIIPTFLDHTKTMVVVSHRANTSNKNTLVQKQVAEITLDSLVQDPISMQFYKSLAIDMRKRGPLVLRV